MPREPVNNGLLAKQNVENKKIDKQIKNFFILKIIQKL